MRLKFAAGFVAIVAATCAILYQIILLASVKDCSSCEPTGFQRSCAFERHQCAEDCIRHGLFHESGMPVTADAWGFTTNIQLEPQTLRAVLYKFGARVACWPSTGGVWVKHAMPLEMSFLGLSLRYDTVRPSDYGPVEEDEFCAKMRLIGAEFWRDPPNMTDCEPLEECVKPTIRGDLGIAWIPGYVKGQGGAHMVNLTDVLERRKLGAGMRGYFQAPTMESRMSVSYSLGGIWCPEEPDKCANLWCTQYPAHCDEAHQLMNDDILWKCEKTERGFW